MTMMKLVKTVIIIWAALVPKSAWASVCVDGKIDYTVELGGAATPAQYRGVMKQLRDGLKGPKDIQNLPVMSKPTSPPKFIYVDLNVAPGTAITLGINMNDIYVQGYCDVYNGKKRARFFKDANTQAKQQLFPTATDRSDMSYTSDYPTILLKADITKSKAGMGVQNLRSLLADVFNKATNEQVEAKFLLVALQMVAEAVRFKYIEDQVVEYFSYRKFVPDCKLLSLQHKWGLISKAIAKSKGGKMDKVTMLNDDGDDIAITQVCEIAPAMGILSYPN